MRLLTHSRAKSFRACQRRHHYSYELCYRAVRQGEALIVGDIFHRYVAEPYWLARKDGHSVEQAAAIALEALRAALETALKAEIITQFVAAKLMVMGICYVSAWNTRPNVTVLEVEKEFNAPLEFDGKQSLFWKVGGKIDLILRLENGSVALVEHKTSSADVGLATPYRRRLVLDEQISIYYEAAHWLGYALDTVIYDVVSKPKQAPYKATPPESRKYTVEKSRSCPECKKWAAQKKGALQPPHVVSEDGAVLWFGDEAKGAAEACKEGRIITDPGGQLYANMREFDETADEYFERVLKDARETPGELVTWIDVSRSDDQRKQFASIFKETVQLMRFSIENDIHPPNSDACFHAGGSPCEFIEVCEGSAFLEDVTKFTKLESGHVELSKGATDE